MFYLLPGRLPGAGGGGEAAGDVAVGVLGVVGSGAFCSFAQAESTPMAMIAPMPAVATRRRAGLIS